MAMIQCPNCGENVSDKARKCIHCGYELMPPEKKYCAECGAELEEDATVCPSCGCPVNAEPHYDGPVEVVAPQQVEITGVKVAKVSKKKIAAIVCVVVILILAVVGVQYYQKQKAQQAHEAEVQKYNETLKTAVSTMLSGASDAEDCGNLIKNVWYNAIYKKSSSETDKYTRPKRYYVDFNTALANLFSDSDFQSEIAGIETNQTTVQALMKDLKTPPEECEDAYEALSDFYNAYLKLTNLVTDPSGSLQTYSSNFSEADTETANCYSAMALYLN